MLWVTRWLTNIPFWGEGGILLAASCYRNRDKFQPDEPLGPCARLYQQYHCFVHQQVARVHCSIMWSSLATQWTSSASFIQRYPCVYQSIDHFLVAFSKIDFMRKCVHPTGSFQCKSDSFSSERFCSMTGFETEGQVTQKWPIVWASCQTVMGESDHQLTGVLHTHKKTWCSLGELYMY